MNKKQSSVMMQQSDPNAFPYYCRWDVAGRKGQKCRILKAGTKTAHVVFEDGFERIISRTAIRQVKGATDAGTQGS
jgi:hypothetical protein